MLLVVTKKTTLKKSYQQWLFLGMVNNFYSCKGSEFLDEANHKPDNATERNNHTKKKINTPIHNEKVHYIQNLPTIHGEKL